jgi:hypothetical protein
MSEPLTDTPAPAPAPAEPAPDVSPAAAPEAASPPVPTLSTAEALRAKLTDSPVPLKLKEIRRDLPNPTNIRPAVAFEAEVKRLLDEEIAAGGAHGFPSASGGEVRYWAADEKKAIRTAALAAAAEPKTLADLKKVARLTTGADAAFSDSVIDELVAEPGCLNRQPSGKASAERFWTRDERQAIREAVLAAAAEPKKLNDLKKVARDATRADRAYAEAIVDEMVSAKDLHPQSSSSKPLFGPHEPPKPHALDSKAAKKAFEALVKAGRKVIEAAPGATTEEVCLRLRTALDMPPEPARPEGEPAGEPAPAAADAGASAQAGTL